MPRKQEPMLVTDLSDEQKLAILNKHIVFEGGEWESLDSQKFCLHCDQSFTGRSVRVFRVPDSFMPDGLELQCGTEGCDGDPKDWDNKPWWRGEPGEG